VLADAATAQLREAYSSQPQQVTRSLEAALRFTLRQQHTLQDSSDRIRTLVNAAYTCVSNGAGSSSSSSGAPGRDESRPAAKQQFSLLATCLKSAVQRAHSSSSSSSSDGSSCTSDFVIMDSATFLKDQMAGQQLCMLFMGYRHLTGPRQLLLQGRCLLHLASSAMLVQQQAAKWAAAAEQQTCGQEEDAAAAAAAASFAVIASQQLSFIV
jgi:hypothetical protein